MAAGMRGVEILENELLSFNGAQADHRFPEGPFNKGNEGSSGYTANALIALRRSNAPLTGFKSIA